MKIVFVTGAGASKPFGFPLGGELPAYIKNRLAEKNVTQSLSTLGHPQSEIDAFLDVLKYSRFPTIDQFLEAKNRFRALGGCLIADCIIRHERHNHLFAIRDWHVPLYKCLMKNFKMGDSRHDISFVTLNYDRSLEYLFTHVSRYECHENEEQKFYQYLSLIPIYHAHGSLGTLEELPYGTTDGKEYDWNNVISAGRRLQIISDNLRDNNVFKEASSHLENADKIIFLGFAFHPSTLESLFEHVQMEKTQIYGTVYQMNEIRIKEVKEWAEKRGNFHNISAETFLKTINEIAGLWL